MIVNGNGLRCMDPQAKEDTRCPGKNKHKWTDDEDDKLVEGFKMEGKKFKNIGIFA
ncbi:hypothetical protein Droror1_Dr00009137 [Drosera rotundifolia]